MVNFILSLLLKPRIQSPFKDLDKAYTSCNVLITKWHGHPIDLTCVDNSSTLVVKTKTGI